eukprot:6491668-Amphidinium_carterae.1
MRCGGNSDFSGLIDIVSLTACATNERLLTLEGGLIHELRLSLVVIHCDFDAVSIGLTTLLACGCNIYMGQRKRRMDKQAAAAKNNAAAQNREMSLPRVAENEVMEMEVTSPSVGSANSYAAVASGASASASSGWDWQAEVRTNGEPEPGVKAQPGPGDGKPEGPLRPGGSAGARGVKAQPVFIVSVAE